VGKRLSGKKAFIALGLTAGNKRAARISHSRARPPPARACRFAILLAADKAINAIGRSRTEQPDCPNLCDVNNLFALFGRSKGYNGRPEKNLLDKQGQMPHNDNRGWMVEGAYNFRISFWR
jgi:hypothetical protein